MILNDFSQGMNFNEVIFSHTTTKLNKKDFLQGMSFNEVMFSHNTIKLNKEDFFYKVWSLMKMI